MNIVNNKTQFPAELDLPPNNQVLFFSLFFGTLTLELQWVSRQTKKVPVSLSKGLQVKGQLGMVGYGWIVSLWATTVTPGTRPPGHI